MLSLDALVWCLPAFVFVAVKWLPLSKVESLLAAGLALVAMAAVWRWPHRAVLVLVAALPFQFLGLAFLYRLGVPGPLVRALAAYRDVIVVGLFVLGFHRARSEGMAFDVLDKLAIAYVVLVTAYLAFPNLFVPTINEFNRIAPQDLSVRLLSYRANVGFVLLLFALRHLPASDELLRRVARVILVAGLVVAAVTVFEFFFSSSWNSFAVHRVGALRYERDVLHTFRPDPGDIRAYVHVGGRTIDRAGSVFGDPIQSGFYLLLPFGIALSLAARRRLSYAYVALPLLAGAILLTYDRSAVLAALVVAGFSLRQREGARVRLALVLGTGAVLLMFAAVAAGFTGRLGGANGSAPNSNTGHLQALHRGAATLAHRPLGVGLGSEPGIAYRFDTGEQVVSENAYLQIGTTVGIPAMVLFVLMLAILLSRLGRLPSTGEGNPLTRSYLPIGLGLAVGGLFLHIWNGIPMALTFWGGAGLVLSAADDGDRSAVGDVTKDVDVLPR